MSFFDAVRTQERGELVIVAPGTGSRLVITFAGPGHPQTVAYNDGQARERLHKEKAQEQARVNGKKWKSDDETVKDRLQKNVTYITARMLGWRFEDAAGNPDPAGGPEFSREVADQLLAEPEMGALYTRCLEYLADDESFTKRSAKT